MDWFTRDIDVELRSPNPPPGEMVATLYLLMDNDFMVEMLKSRGTRMGTVAGISHDPYHPLYSKVRRAFDWAQKRRKLAGFQPDPWPMRFVLPVLKDRRLTWSPVMEEIKDACRMYRRFIREGFRPFSVDSQGEPTIPVSSFDPQAGELIFRVGDRHGR